jgi:hypothetical protein
MKIDRLKRSKKNVMLSEAERSRSISTASLLMVNDVETRHIASRR